MYQGLLIGALGWATGKVEADVEPNIRKVTPHYDQLPTRGAATTPRAKAAPAAR